MELNVSLGSGKGYQLRKLSITIAQVLGISGTHLAYLRLESATKPHACDAPTKDPERNPIRDASADADQGSMSPTQLPALTASEDHDRSLCHLHRDSPLIPIRNLKSPKTICECFGRLAGLRARCATPAAERKYPCLRNPKP